MKNLKKFFGVMLVMAVCAMFTVSCGTPTVEEMVTEINSKLPQKLSGGMSITKVSYADKTVMYEITVDENVAQLTDDEDAMLEARQQLIDYYKPNVSKDPLLQAIVDQNLTFRAEYVGSQSGDGFYIEIYPEDLK